jgi:hypothetical protein
MTFALDAAKHPASFTIRAEIAALRKKGLGR